MRAPRRRLLAPAFDSTHEVTGHCEAECSEPRRHPVDDRKRALRKLAESAGLGVGRAAPAVAEQRGETVADCTHRSQQNEPRHYAEDVPVRAYQPEFDGDTRDFAPGELTGRFTAPVAQRLAGLNEIARAQRQHHVVVIVTELAEAEREVQYCHVPGQCKHPAHVA